MSGQTHSLRSQEELKSCRFVSEEIWILFRNAAVFLYRGFLKMRLTNFRRYNPFMELFEASFATSDATPMSSPVTASTSRLSYVLKLSFSFKGPDIGAILYILTVAGWSLSARHATAKE